MDLFCSCSVLCLLCLCARLFICALWSPAGKGLTSWLLLVVSNCEFVTFPLVSWGQVWYLIVLIPDLCTLTYFVLIALNLFKPNGISHSYQLDWSISILRVVEWYFSFLFKF